MPKRLEEAFKRSAAKRGLTEGSDEWNAYVYGGMKKAEDKQDGSEGGDGNVREQDGDSHRD